MLRAPAALTGLGRTPSFSLSMRTRLSATSSPVSLFFALYTCLRGGSCAPMEAGVQRAHAGQQRVSAPVSALTDLLDLLVAVDAAGSPLPRLSGLVAGRCRGHGGRGDGPRREPQGGAPAPFATPSLVRVAKQVRDSGSRLVCMHCRKSARSLALAPLPRAPGRAAYVQYNSTYNVPGALNALPPGPHHVQQPAFWSGPSSLRMPSPSAVAEAASQAPP